MMGSPMVRFLCGVQGKLKSLAVMNLKILFTFILWVALEKNRVAFIALAYALACISYATIINITKSTSSFDNTSSTNSSPNKHSI